MKLHMIFSIFMLGFTLNVFAQDVNVLRTKHFNTEQTVAIKGYDPVTYFGGTRPVKGNGRFKFSYGNITYYFATEANLNAFKANPSKYEPQFGGWCAYAMGAKGEKVEVDPKTFKLVNGKLYLFYNSLFNNTLNTWNENEPALLQKANTNWKNTFK